MGLTQGVRVWSRRQVDTDPMGEPVYEWAHADVDGVLVRTATTSGMEDKRGDAAGSLRPDGVRVRYVLAFPKGYDGPPLARARVTLLNPAYGMDLSETDGWRTALVVSGDPAPQVPCPTRWNMVVEVGRTDG